VLVFCFSYWKLKHVLCANACNQQPAFRAAPPLACGCCHRHAAHITWPLRAVDPTRPICQGQASKLLPLPLLLLHSLPQHREFSLCLSARTHGDTSHTFSQHTRKSLRPGAYLTHDTPHLSSCCSTTSSVRTWTVLGESSAASYVHPFSVSCIAKRLKACLFGSHVVPPPLQTLTCSRPQVAIRAYGSMQRVASSFAVVSTSVGISHQLTALCCCPLLRAHTHN
jgi:hypothetical protein